MFACCDESGVQKKSRWLVIGAMWLPDDQHLPKYEADATALRQRTNCWGEFKWEKVDPMWLAPYQQFLKLTFALPNLKFTSMVVDTHLLTPEDMRKYHGSGNRSEAFLKFVRLLLRYRIARFVARDHEEFTLLYDKLSVRRDLVTTFRDVVAGDMKKLAVSQNANCRFVHFGPVNSATLHLVQATDLLTGATRSAWDAAVDTSNKREARLAIVDQIAQWAGGELTETGFHWDRYYNLWKWKP